MKIKKINVESVAVILMCLYSIMMYAVYIDKSMESINTLVLYAFLGVSVLTLLCSRKTIKNNYLLWYSGFILLAFIAALYAPETANSIKQIYTLLVVFGLTTAMSVVLTNKNRIELLMNCLVLGSVLLIVYLIATGKTDINSETGDRLGNTLTGNANIFACIFMVSACSSVYFLMAKPKIYQKAVYLIAFGFQMYALVLSGGRKYPLVPFLVWFFINLFKTDKRGKKHIFKYLIIGVSLLLVIYYLLINTPFLYEYIGHRFESLVEYTLGLSQSTDASTAERELMRQKAYELWSESPLFGKGFSAFAQIGGFGVYSHCNYLELLCNQGIIGFLYYYGFWGYLLFKIYALKRNSLIRLFLGAVLCGLLIYDYGAISYNTPITHYFALMATLYIKDPEMFDDCQYGEMNIANCIAQEEGLDE